MSSDEVQLSSLEAIEQKRSTLQHRRDEAWNYVLECDRELRLLDAQIRELQNLKQKSFGF